jgi:hypothetical protein
MAEATNINPNHQKQRHDPGYLTSLHWSAGIDFKPAAL